MARVTRRNGRWVQRDTAVWVALSPAQRSGRRLASALIAGAICAVAQPTYLRALYRHQDERTLATLRAADLRWLLSDDGSRPFSFLACCDALGLDPDAVRYGLRLRGWLTGEASMTALEVRRILAWVRSEEGGDADAASDEGAAA